MTETGVGRALPITGLDRALALALHRSPRARMSTLAEQLGVSERTVARRMRQLRAEGLLRLTTSSLPPLHPHLHAQVEITCGPDRILEVANQLADRADTHYVHLTAGSADVWVEFYAQSQAELLHWLTVELPRVDGVVSTRTRMVVRMLMSANDWDPEGSTSKIGRAHV